MASISYTQIKGELAHFIGTPEVNWDSTTSTAIESCIRTGIDRVVHNGLHQWTWMRPRFAMHTADGQRRYTLPSDFEQFVSDLYFDGVNYTYPPVTQAAASRLMQLHAEYATTGTPSRFAIEAVPHDGVTEQDQQLVLHPTPDADYELIGVYQIGLRLLSDNHPYPPGGAAHGELFLASCLAAAEAKFLDGPADKRMQFQDLLTAHIAIDLRRQPRNLGRLGDPRHGMLGRSNARQVYDLVSGLTTYLGGTDV